MFHRIPKREKREKKKKPKKVIAFDGNSSVVVSVQTKKKKRKKKTTDSPRQIHSVSAPSDTSIRKSLWHSQFDTSNVDESVQDQLKSIKMTDTPRSTHSQRSDSDSTPPSTRNDTSYTGTSPPQSARSTISSSDQKVDIDDLYESKPERYDTMGYDTLDDMIVEDPEEYHQSTVDDYTSIEKKDERLKDEREKQTTEKKSFEKTDNQVSLELDIYAEEPTNKQSTQKSERQEWSEESKKIDKQPTKPTKELEVKQTSLVLETLLEDKTETTTDQQASKDNIFKTMEQIDSQTSTQENEKSSELDEVASILQNLENVNIEEKVHKCVLRTISHNILES